MNAQQLKKSILQYAMEGKLIKPASFKEDFTDQDLDSIEMKMDNSNSPFEIPNSWSWFPLKELGIIQTGNTPSTTQTEYYNENYIPFIKPGDFYADGSLNYDNQYLSKKGALKSRLVEPKSIMMVCIGGSRGKCSKVTRQVAFNQQINTITPNPEICNWEYLFYIFSSDYFQRLMQYRATGTATPIINKSTWSDFLIPLPSLKEQSSILKKIKELEEKVRTYDELFETLENIKAKFPADLEKSILQWAMQGKLVTQRATEEPANILIEKIKEEKEKLVKQKVIKKEKKVTLSITDDEIPHDIPDTWKWVRIKDIYYNEGQKNPDKEFCYVDVGCIDNKTGFITDSYKILLPEEAPSRARKIVKQGNIIYSTVRPYLQNIALVNREFEHEIIASTAFMVINPIHIDNKYLFYVLRSPYLNSLVESKMIGATYPAINDTIFNNLVIPIPPLEEQKRIVVKIEELLSITKKLKPKLLND